MLKIGDRKVPVAPGLLRASPRQVVAVRERWPLDRHALGALELPQFAIGNRPVAQDVLEGAALARAEAPASGKGVNRRTHEGHRGGACGGAEHGRAAAQSTGVRRRAYEGEMRQRRGSCERKRALSRSSRSEAIAERRLAVKSSSLARSISS